MKMWRFGLALGVVALVLVPLAAQQVNQSLDAELRRAAQKEVVSGDLKAAIDTYKSIVARAGADHATAAKALLRLAEAYQKLGDKQAQTVYEQIISQYADQKEAAAIASARLGTTAVTSLNTQRVREDGGGRVSPDGRYQIAESNEGNNLAVRELATGRIRRLTSDGVMNDPGEYPLSSAFSADGKQIAYGWYFDREQRGVLRVTSTDENNGARQRTLHDNKEFSSISPTDWSPDGKWIAAVIRRIDRTAQIGVFNASDGSLRVLKTVDWSRVGGLRFSPDSSMLAYHRPGKEGAFERDVFVIAVDGTRETAIADSPGDDTVLEWMPDGQHVLIASDRGGSMSVWSVPSRGPAPPSSYELIKSDIGIVSSLGLTRDGVLYYRVLPSRSNIYVASFDVATGQLASSPLQPVRQFKGFNSAPELSGDGKYLAYASRRDIPAPINVTRSIVPILSMETGQIVREMAPGVSYWGIGRWSPDGRQFILRGADLKGRSGILSIDAVTGETALVAPNETCSGVPFWSPDSATVFCYQFNDKRIVRLDVKTGTVVRTFPAAGQGAGASPDGRYIVYWGDADDLRLLELATGQTREIIRLPPTASQFGNLMTFDWTPDSAAVVFYGKLNGDEGMWLAPIDGRAPHKIRLDVGPVFSWRFNPKTGQVAFGTDRIDGKVEMWKMEHFLPAGHK